MILIVKPAPTCTIKPVLTMKLQLSPRNLLSHTDPNGAIPSLYYPVPIDNSACP